MTPIDSAAMRRKLFSHIHRGGQFAYWWTSEGKETTWWPVTRPAPMPTGKVNVYFGVHPVAAVPQHTYLTGERAGQVKPARETRPHIGDVCAVNCLFAEFDGKDFEDDKAGALSHIVDLVPPASVLVDSGGGYHAYWLLAEPVELSDDETRQRVRDLQTQWVEYVDGDRGAKDLSRVLRVPGTRNFKEKHAPDFPEVSFVWYEDTVYTLDELAGYIPPKPLIEGAHIPAPAVELSDAQRATRRARYVAAALHNEALTVQTSREGARNSTLHRAAVKLGSLVDPQYLTRGDVEATLAGAARAAGLGMSEIQATLASGLEFGLANPRTIPDRSNGSFKPGAELNAFDFVAPPLKAAQASAPQAPAALLGAPTLDPSPLPSVQVNARQLREITADVLDVFRRAGHERTGLFVRGGIVSRVVRDERGHAAIEVVSEAALTGIMTRAANFYRLSTAADGSQVKRTDDPPQKVVRDILSLGQLPLEPIEGVIESPTMRPDGSVLDAPGYDRSTGMYYSPTPDLYWPGVPDAPTRRQVEDALESLADLVRDFPFAGHASRANWLGLFMTAVLRPAIRSHVPMALVDATTQGTGKTMLSELPSILATGANPTLLAMPYTGEEWIKTITTTLMGNHPIVVLDNVGREIYADELAQVLTADVWTCRILGTNQSARVAARSIWVANGNNVKVRGDFSSRCYWIRLESKISRPWERNDFSRDDLRAYVRANRGEIIAAVLTMARAWWLAGQPARATPVQMRSFTEWSRVIGGILEFAGEPNFLSNAGEFYDQVDEETPQWETFLVALLEKFGSGKPFTVAQACNHISGDVFSGNLSEIVPTSLGEALDDHGNIRSGFKHRLGKAFSKRVGTRYGDSGVRIDRRSEPGSGVVRWAVEVG